MNLFDFLSDDFPAKSSQYEDRESYYLQFIESTDINFYLSFFKEEEGRKVIKTDQRIKLFDLEFNAGIENVQKNMGTPRLKASYKKNGLKTTVLFYKKQFYNYKLILQFHFINNNLVYGCLTVPYHNKKIVSTFEKLLSIKYNETISNNLENSIIVDFDNNRIVYRTYFYPSLIYVGNNVPQMTSLLKKSDESKMFRIQKHSSEWYERL